MTLFLVLGRFAGLCMIWPPFNLAVPALPVGAGISIASWMRDHDHGYIAAILGGFAAGIAILLIGQFLFAAIRAPLLRLALVVMSAIPADSAGTPPFRASCSLRSNRACCSGCCAGSALSPLRSPHGRGSRVLRLRDRFRRRCGFAAHDNRTAHTVSDRIFGTGLYAGTVDGTP